MELALSEEVIRPSPTKTDHYQTNFPSGTLVFRSCPIPSGHSRSCVGSRKSNPRKNAQKDGKYITYEGVRTVILNVVSVELVLLLSCGSGQLQRRFIQLPVRVLHMATSDPGTRSLTRPASCRTDCHPRVAFPGIRPPSNYPAFLEEYLNSNTYGANQLSPSRD